MRPLKIINVNYVLNSMASVRSYIFCARVLELLSLFDVVVLPLDLLFELFSLSMADG